MKNKTFKKSLSVIMAVLMLMTSWVFFPGEHNHVSAANEEVSVTTSFTLSPNGNRGSTDWTRLALTGESAAAGTSVILFRFSNADLQKLAEKDVVNLKFYAYSCNNRLTHTSGTAVNADIYYIIQNGTFVSSQGINKSTNVTDTGNAVLGTNYSGTNMQNSAKSYFGLSDATFVGSFEQPAINGQDNTALRTGDANYMYPVTDIVKEKAAVGEDLSFIVMLRQGYTCSGSAGWSDIYINSDTIALSGYDMLEELKSKIEAYEGYFANGTFYTNLVNNYKAYNDAKRYYDAVKYGGVQFDVATAQGYMAAIDTAIANTGYNDTYVDYLNANITSRDGSTVSADYRKNVIWYPWDFSWNITSNNARPTIQDTYFYYTMPNTIVGITNDSETTFPLHTFFWTTTGSRYVRYVIAGSGTISSGVVGSSDFSTKAPWKISNWDNGHDTGGLEPGADGFGGWVFEKNYLTDVTLDYYEDNSSNYGYSQDHVYQISSYAQINKSSIGVNASNVYKKVDQGFTFATANSANGGTTNYGNHYASNYNSYGGYLYVVYMDTYKNNYQNWKTLIPAISYKDYNGFVYSDATNVTTHLDYASAIPLNLSLTEANRAGNIDSTVTVWAQNINKGANDLVNAKAAGTTRVTNKYIDLINAISNAEAAYAEGSAKYTYQSWNNFVAAYNAAKAHMASLDPSGSNVQYSSDSTAIGNLATALNSARDALEARTYDVTYENIFSFSSWANSASAVVGTPAKGTMTYDVNAGTITVNNNGANTQTNPNDHYTSQDFGNGHYNMTLVPGETYTFKYTTSGGTGDQVHIFFYDDAGNAVENKANSGAPFAHAYGTGRGTHTISFTAPQNATKAAFRFGTTVLGDAVTFSNIFMYSHTRGDYADIANWTYSPNRTVFVYNNPLGTTLEVPVREGYTFDGWWVDSIIPNGQKDEGEQVTDGTGTVVSALQNFGIIQDWVLYSEWTINKYTVTWKNEDGTVLETDIDVEYGTTPSYNSATPTKAADAQYTYTFEGWSPEVTEVKGDVTYIASYKKTPNSVTVTWKFADGTERTETYTYGTTPTAPENTVGYNDANGHHTYSWPAITSATGDVTYEEVLSTIAHTPGASATCTTAQTCTVCGAVITAALGHTEVVIPAVSATCTSTGLTEGKKCSVCGTVTVAQTETPMLAHTEVEIPAKEATCTSTGLTAGKECSVCGTITVAQTETPMLAHSLGDWIIDLAATCIADGEKHRECANCDYTEEETIKATGVHEYGTWKKYNDTTHRRTCTLDSNCGAYEEGTHAFNSDVKPKSDSTSFHDYKCDVCDARGAKLNGVDKIDAAESCYGEGTTFAQITDNDTHHKETCKCGREQNDAHTYGDWYADPENKTDKNGQMSRTCSECSYKQTTTCKYVKVDGSYTAPDCENTGSQGWKCSDCGNSYTETLPANGHSYGEWIDETPATCVATGTKGHYECSVCKKYFDTDKNEITDLTIKIDPDNHDIVNHEAKAPTCTEIGWGAYETCKREGCDYTTYVEKEALKHDWKEVTYTWSEDNSSCTTERVCNRDANHTETAEAEVTSEEKTAATCTEKGWTTYTAKFEAGWATEQTKNVQDIPALDHDYDDTFTVDLKASCVTTGSKSRHCSRCDAKTDVTVIPIRDHVIVDTTEEKAATCLETGIMNQKCTNAATDEYEACEHTDTRVIPALGHTFGTVTNANAATCVATGNEAYKQCETCKLYFAENAEKDSADGKNDITSFVIGIDSTNHKNTTEHEETPATCTSVGYTAGEFCEDCDKWILGHDEIEAIAHKNSVYHEKVEETCISEGTIEYWSCPDCSKNFNDEACTNEVTNLKIGKDASKHTKLNKTDAKDETCEDEGNIEYWTCEGCKEIYSDEEAETKITVEDTIIAPKGHKYGDWEFVADGQHKRTCANDVSHIETEACDDSDTDNNCDCDKCGTLVAHSYGDASCDAPATCTVCGATTGDKLGHSFTNYVSNGDATCTEDGTKTAKCDRCDATDKVKDEGSALGHKDENKDHACDNNDCDVYQGIHEDANNDHKCDYGCSETIGICVDADFDHDCDYGCDKVYGEHVDTDTDHVCDYGCSETIGTCGDADFDHDCDYGCDKVYGTHEDADKDHVCDYGCSETIGTCVDADFDHDCDYGCNKVYGAHEDTDKDHVCDYGCSEAIGTCVDADFDHDCDYGCDKVYGTHEDTDKNHACDYGCSVSIGECKDDDKDHKCDHGCNKVYGEHVDADTDHVCDYGCKEAIGTCGDADKDHKCDHGCGKDYGEHVDTDTDHVCDYGCKEAIGTCVDADFDHDCDYGCDKVYGEHVDADTDHVCDYGCKEAIGICVDADFDHDCDYGCDKVYGTHEDTDKDHVCDYGCSETIGTCEDTDFDHDCDYGCDKVYGTHEDTDKDHVCDYGCSVAIGTCGDADKDHKCDHGCGKDYGEHVDADKNHACDYGCSETIGTCEDADKDHKCDHGCGKDYGEHVDADKNHACDYGCKETIGTCVDADKDHDCDYGCDKVYGEHIDADTDHVCDYGCSETIGECTDSATDKDHVCDYGCGAILENCTDGDDNNHNCDVCDEENVSEHIWVDADCTTPKTCSVCSATEGKELGHNYDKTKSEQNLTRPEFKDGVWTQGYYTYTCKNDSSHKDYEYVNRASYNDYEAAWNALESLLSTDLTAEAKEAIQGVLDANIVDEDLIATEEEQKIIDDATANLKAAFEQYKGSLKTYTVTFVIDGKETKVTVISGQSAIAPTDVKKAYNDLYHYEFKEWDKEFTNIISDLTVTALFETFEHNYTTHTDKDDTYHTDKCDCGYSKDVEHTETSKVTAKASCYADGVKTYTCSVCGGTRTETIAKREHNLVDTTVALAPTCSATGIMNQKCDHEGSDEYEACTYTTTRVIPAKDHNMVAGEVVAPTCATDGYTVYTCSYGCGKTESKDIVPATGAHVYSIEKERVEATCTGEGYVIMACGCGAEKKEILSAAAGKHKWNEEGIVLPEEAPSCIKEGIRRHYCEYDCGWYKEEILEKTDHTYDEGTVVAPTCMNKGYTRYNCIIDGCTASYDTDVTAALDHNYSYVVTAPTCDSEGYTTCICSECTYTCIDAATIVPATGHADENGDGNCDSCKVNIVGACKCLCHSTNWLLRIIYKIIRFIWKLFKISPVCGCGAVHY